MSLSEDEVLAILQKVGAFRAGHFAFTSGLHADTYVNKDAVYPYTEETSKLCKEIASRFKDKDVDAVLGPAVAAAVLSQWTAHHLTEMKGKQIYAVYADKDGQGGFIVRRGYNEIIKGKNVLVVEDLTTTGGTIKKVVTAARASGANVVGAVALCNRGEVTREAVGNPPEFVSLLNLSLEQWPEGECELCEKGIPINTDVGHGKEFLARAK